MTPKKILITGCSYACGEWANDDNGSYGISHRGTEQYLKMAGHDVVNTSSPGGSNGAALDSIRNRCKNFDLVIFFLTAVSRDIGTYLDGQKVRYSKTHSAVENCKMIADLVLKELNTISVPEKTIVVGALYKIPANNYKFKLQFNGMDLLIPDNEFPQHYFNPHDFVEYHARKQIDLETLKSQLPHTRDEKFWETMEKNPQWYRPDGCHWNRSAHKKIADYILKHI